MKVYLQGLCAALALGAMALGTGCVATVGGEGAYYYDYDYYPDWDVYYYPEHHVYYWNEEGRWHSAERLPEHYDLRNRHVEHLHSHNREPWNGQRGGEHHHDHD